MEDICNICCTSLVNKDKTKLLCNHEYHYDCIYSWYEKTLTLHRGNINKCPYCSQDGGYLPLPSGITYKKEIHGPVKPTNILNNNCCKAYTKMGKPCKKKGHYEGYCKIHKKCF